VVLGSRTIAVRASATALAEWVVREIDAGGVPAASAPRCLVFESESVVRRVWRYPADWESLSDTQLYDLMTQAHC